MDLTTSDVVIGRLDVPDLALRRCEAVVHALDPMELAAVQCATMECKSLVLALNLLAGQMSIEEVCDASRLEEEFQLIQWGVVEGGHDVDRIGNRVSVASAKAFLRLRDVGVDAPTLFAAKIGHAAAAVMR